MKSLNWFAGQKAYELIKIDTKKPEAPKKEEEGEEAKEKRKKK
jgi:hypothetical protein